MSAHPQSAKYAMVAYALHLNENALEYRDTSKIEAWDYETNMVDLLADLMHYASDSGLDFEGVMDSATLHYVSERSGEEL